jgi:hypothetical protein
MQITTANMIHSHASPFSNAGFDSSTTSYDPAPEDGDPDNEEQSNDDHIFRDLVDADIQVPEPPTRDHRFLNGW